MKIIKKIIAQLPYAYDNPHEPIIELRDKMNLGVKTIPQGIRLEFYTSSQVGLCNLIKPIILDLQMERWPIQYFEIERVEYAFKKAKILELPTLIIYRGDTEIARKTWQVNKRDILLWVKESL